MHALCSKFMWKSMPWWYTAKLVLHQWATAVHSGRKTIHFKTPHGWIKNPPSTAYFFRKNSANKRHTWEACACKCPVVRLLKGLVNSPTRVKQQSQPSCCAVPRVLTKWCSMNLCSRISPADARNWKRLNRYFKINTYTYIICIYVYIVYMQVHIYI